MPYALSGNTITMVPASPAPLPVSRTSMNLPPVLQRATASVDCVPVVEMANTSWPNVRTPQTLFATPVPYVAQMSTRSLRALRRRIGSVPLALLPAQLGRVNLRLVQAPLTASVPLATLPGMTEVSSNVNLVLNVTTLNHLAQPVRMPFAFPAVMVFVTVKKIVTPVPWTVSLETPLITTFVVMASASLDLERAALTVPMIVHRKIKGKMDSSVVEPIVTVKLRTSSRVPVMSKVGAGNALTLALSPPTVAEITLARVQSLHTTVVRIARHRVPRHPVCLPKQSPPHLRVPLS